MPLFVNAINQPASFTISLAALSPVSGVSWASAGVPPGIQFTTSDDTGITFTAFPSFVNNKSSMSVRATLEDATTANATFAISSGSSASLPAASTYVSLPVTNGLIAQYDAASWNNALQVWLDRSGNGNNTSPEDVRGTINYDSVNGFLFGATTAGIRFPAAIVNSAGYTFIHLAKYNNGVKQRIFQGVTNDWASGFINGKAGVAFHNGYITQSASDLYNYRWVVSSDQRNKYRAQSVDFTTGTAGSPGYGRIGLNYGLKTAEYSTWAVAEVLVYNRILTDAELASVENYLRTKYLFLSIQFDTTTGSAFTVPQSNQQASVGTVEWSYKAPLPPGVTFTGSTQLGASFVIATGTLLENRPFIITASGNGGQSSKSFNLLAASRALLTTPNIAIDTTNANTFTVAQTANGTGPILWAYSTLPPGVAFTSNATTRIIFSVLVETVVAPTPITITASNVLKTPTSQTFTYGAGVKPVLTLVSAVPVTSLDSSSVKTFEVSQAVVDAFTGGITWTFSTLPTGLSVTTTNGAASFTLAAGSVIPLQTITVTATNLGGVSTVLTFQLGAATKTVLVSIDRLLNTASASAQFTIVQSAVNTGTIAWSYILPTNLTFVSSSSTGITFQVARGLVVPSQPFTVTATNSVGTPTSLTITLGAGTQPVLSNPGNLILNTTVINQSFTITQDKSPTNTGPITWTISPAPGTFPAGVTVSSQDDYGTTITILVGSVLPYQQFIFTATAISGWVTQRILNVGASSIVQLQSPGDPQLLDTTTQKTVTIAQIYSPALTGPVTWTVTPSSYPAGVSITTQTDSQTIFTFAVNSYLTRQLFTVLARSAGGLESQIQFDIGAAVKPVIGTLVPLPVSGTISLNTYTGAKTIVIPQTINPAYTGTITWTTNPTTLPGSTTKAPLDTSLTLTVPTQPTGVIHPSTTFVITATNPIGNSTSTTFNAFAPRIPSVNDVSPATRTVDVSSAAYTSITATQSATDALPIVWSYSPTTSGVTINSTTGLFTIAQATYFTATTFTVTATNSVGSASSKTFTVTTPAPPVVNTVSPTSPQTIDVSASLQTLSFTNTASLTGTLVWSLTGTPIVGVTINSSTGDMTINQGTFFTATTFTIRATNPVGVFDERSVSVTTPAVPTVTSLVVSPQTRDVSSTPTSIQFTQSTPIVGTVVWTYSPTTSGVTIDSSTGLLTIAQGTYFTATTFTVRATNAVSRFGTLAMNVTTPAPPVVDTSAPTSPQTIDVSTAAQPFTFTNTASFTGTLAWTYTTTRTGVTMNSSTGVLTIAQSTFFTVTTFTIRATNPVGVVGTRSFVVTTPTPPVITGPTSTGSIVGSRVYVNNTVSSKTVTIAQTATNTGTITWSGTGSLPVGVTKTTENNTTLTFTIGLLAVLRPAASAFARTNNATNPAGKAATAISYDVFTPQTPALGTPSPAPVGGTIILDTSASQKTITIAQTVAAANTDTIVWTYPAGISVSESDTQLVATFGVGVTVVPATSVTISAANRAGMSSGGVTFSIYAPALPIINSVADQSLNTTTTAQPFSVYQTVLSAPNQITWSTSPNAASLLAYGITYSVVATTAGTVGGLNFSVALGSQITPALSITVTATNGAGAPASRTFNVTAGNPPSLSNPGTLFLDTTTAKTITVTNSGGTSPALTWNTPAYPTGASTSSTSNTQFIIAVAVNSIFAASSITVTGGNSIGSSSSTFSVTANKIPVVTTPGGQNFDTTTSAQTFTVSQTSGGTGITWSMTYMDGSAIPASITLINSSDTSVTVRIAQTTQVGPSNFRVTAANSVGSTNTENFQISTFYYVAPTVNDIGTFPILDTTTSYSFVTASLSNSQAAGTVSWSIVSGPAGISINSSSGDISIAQGTVITSDTVTVRATNAAGTGDTAFVVAANVKPVLVNQLGDFINLNTMLGAVQIGRVLATAGTNLSWDYALVGPSVATRGKRYSSTGVDITNSQYPLEGYVVDNSTKQTLILNQGGIFDGGTQASFGIIRVTASNAGGSTAIDLYVMAYPYIITNWNDTVSPGDLFYIDFPYKASNQTNKHWTTGITTGGFLRLGTTATNQSSNAGLTYNYRLNRIISNFGGYVGWALVGQLDGSGFNYFVNTALTNYPNSSINIAANPQWITWDFYFYRQTPQVYGVWLVNVFDNKYLDSGGGSGNWTVQYQATIDANGDFFGNQRAQNKSRFT